MKVLPIAGVLLVLLACGGIYIMLQAKKKASAQRPDPDSDYTEDEEEYAIPEEDKSESFEDGSDYDTKPDGSKE